MKVIHPFPFPVLYVVFALTTGLNAAMPQGIAKSDWSGIRAAYEAGRQAYEPVPGQSGNWQSRNPGQQWLTTFDQRGFTAVPEHGAWSWGLQLQSYGFGTQQQLISSQPAVQAVGQRLSYQWDATVQEWFVNDQRGLEHGFTVARRPAGDAEASTLSFLLGTRGSLQPRIAAGAQGVAFCDAAGTPQLNYTGLKVWDADGKVLPAHFEPAEDNGVRLLVDERGARYPITIDPTAQQAMLKGSNAGGNDDFGLAVAISGDTVVVGAHYEDSDGTGVNGTQGNNNASDSGAAYVFARSAGVWTQQAYLKASNAQSGDHFGEAVAISGDTIVVCAPSESSNATGVNGNQADNSAANTGAAYIFTRTAGVWTQQAYLKASNSAPSDYFGGKVSVSGDTVLVTATGEDSSATGVNGNQADNSATNTGAAYIFTRSAGVWTQQAYLKASNTTNAEFFGVSGDLYGDTAVIGTYLEASNATGVNGNQSNTSAPASGAAYVFTRSAGVWTQQAYLKASNTQTNDFFGRSISLFGDTLVVSADGEDSNATGVNGNQADNSAADTGAAYVFTRNAGVWTQQAYLKASTETDDYFGTSVAVYGDALVVTAPGEDSNATTVGGDQANNSAVDSGAAYVFIRNAGVWTQQDYLKAANAEARDQFGIAVALSGDTAIVGANAEDSDSVGSDAAATNATQNAGAAYAFTLALPPNSVPTISDVGDQNISQDTSTTDLAITLGDTETPVADLSLSGTSSNQTLVPESGIVLGGSGANRTVTVTPAAEEFGTATITLTVTDSGGKTATDTFLLTVTQSLEMRVLGNGNVITNGDTTPATTDGTNFGSQPVLSSYLTRTFTIRNSRAVALNLTGNPLVAISGAAAGDFSLAALPATPIASGATTTFQLTFDPKLPGLRTATVSIASDDPATNPYTFDISGFGVLSTLLTQTIAFITPATVYLGQSPLTLTATASSGLPVTLSVVSGLASLSGNALTLTAPGTVKVQATQPGSGNYKAATAVTKTIVVKATPMALTLINLNQTYTGTPRAIDTLGAVSPVITYKVGTTYVTDAPTNAGSYPVKAVAGAVTKTGTLVITKAVLTVTPGNQRKFVNQVNPALTAVVTGFIGSDTVSVFTKPIVLTTTATLVSAGGLYPIIGSGAVAANYAFNYQQGTLVVESFAGSYEALLADSTPLPVGKLTLLVAANNKTFTGKLYTVTETAAIALAGPLVPNLAGELTTGSITVTKLGVPYATTFSLPLTGKVQATTTRSALAFGSATDGRKVSTRTVLYAGAHTAVLEPVLPAASNLPAGAGWATATIGTTGSLILTGKLADGTAFTSTLPADGESDPGYRLWVQPYLAVRAQSYLTGAFALAAHPTLANRRYLNAANLTWKKTGLPADASYRAGFGPATTVLTLDPWLKPVAATKTAPAVTLAQRLGLTDSSFAVTHSATSSASQSNLPTRVALSAANVVSVTLPVTNPLNITKWKTTTLNTTTGTFSGSFEVKDSAQPRPVLFTGILRQPASGIDPVIGDGHYLLPAVTGAPTNEQLSGEVLFQRP